jgi:hypothetical protein
MTRLRGYDYQTSYPTPMKARSNEYTDRIGPGYHFPPQQYPSGRPYSPNVTSRKASGAHVPHNVGFPLIAHTRRSHLYLDVHRPCCYR